MEVSMTQTETPKMEATFSMLVMSIASSAAMAMGLTPDPQSNQTSVDKNLARFNIDLLEVMQSKTKGNLTTDENQFLTALISDLQLKFLTIK
jgi:hypothetical protein